MTTGDLAVGNIIKFCNGTRLPSLRAPAHLSTFSIEGEMFVIVDSWPVYRPSQPGFSRSIEIQFISTFRPEIGILWMIVDKQNFHVVG